MSFFLRLYNLCMKFVAVAIHSFVPFVYACYLFVQFSGFAFSINLFSLSFGGSGCVCWFVLSIARLHRPL